MSALRLDIALEDWKLRRPFQITGHVFTATRVLVVTLRADGYAGRGEAAGVYYLQDTPDAAAQALDALRPRIEAGITRQAAQALLPPGAARNALDCALWDLQSARSGLSVAALAGLQAPRPLVSAFTLGAEAPALMAEAARAYRGAQAIKLKLTGDGTDAARVAAVREACPQATLYVDANQGFTPQTLEDLWAPLLACGVKLVEQPFPRGQEHLLDGLARPIPVAADESVLTLADVETLPGLFDVVNIKLDKSGGLTEALAMAQRARALGLGVMVGNMTGTSLAMAPAFVLGQICDICDLDGAIFLAEDRTPAVQYHDGQVFLPEAFWGGIATGLA